MRERAMLIGAGFTIEPGPDRGTEVKLSIPVDEHHP
jgi:two-component system sensor histidine kinase UhpB